ncbi:hypothetical protein TI05_15015 [Achromatium sp. WMS3]|nr:hypothetical protein TI05_15015 [Achromatium sp. WMS3]
MEPEFWLKIGIMSNVTNQTIKEKYMPIPFIPIIIGAAAAAIAYSTGKSSGHSTGYDKGRSTGYNEGRSRGYEAGHFEGSSLAKNSIIASIIIALIIFLIEAATRYYELDLSVIQQIELFFVRLWDTSVITQVAVWISLGISGVSLVFFIIFLSDTKNYIVAIVLMFLSIILLTISYIGVSFPYWF